MCRRLTGWLLLLLSLILLAVPASATTAEDALSIANDIIAWKKADIGAAPNEYLLNDTFLKLAGSTEGDWYSIGLSRLGISDNYNGYLAVLKDYVEEQYRQPGKLSATKVTEWHRISLAVLSAGGDPTQFGTDPDGQPINLIADGTYYNTSLGKQGINGWIWGLIALDSMRYEIPANANYSREDIITEILCLQLTDGGFALSGQTADPDVTAMAIQALAPYYDSETVYSDKTVRQAVEEALNCLSAMQLDTGDFASWGIANVESTDQVVIALCSLGIDPLNDPRFIKNGNTLLDGILRYQMSDGGFSHYLDDMQSGQSHTMAGEQTLYAMAAIWRQAEGMRSLYDFRSEEGGAANKQVSNPEEQSSFPRRGIIAILCIFVLVIACFIVRKRRVDSLHKRSRAE